MTEMREFINSIVGITDRDEMISAIAKIPDEDLRPLLAMVAISWNHSIKADQARFSEQSKTIYALEEKIRELEEQVTPS